ncbi:uroporphyrinogen-III C-methyltransferase [Alysiella sp.]|uniref:uroporphyrinogen-III C-methyltransferase n=1 Tax=Alysiella sp. TaxID=1872483 RepID=UPI0026DC4BC2|nr:uroporphyrinogen-III C-methyltransferase [Alysiella sp.]
MSDTPNTPTQDDKNTVINSEYHAQNTLSNPVQAATSPVVVQQNGGKGFAVGALVLSVLALGASGLLFVQGQNTLKNQDLRFIRELDKAGLGNSQNALLLENSLNQQEKLHQQLMELNHAQNATTQHIKGIDAAYAELLKGRVNWLVDETEVTLNIASQQLILSGNVPVAVGVLENVEQRLSRFEQAELLPIKQAISQDLADLKNRPYLNVTALTLRLDRLQSAVSSLPLTLDDTLKEKNAPEAIPQSGGFWQRTWDSTVALTKNMFEVRHLSSSDTMLLSPEQVYFVRENLRLRLLDARLALLQHNGEIYQNDLNAVATTVKQYFDTASPNTQAWLKELEELKSLEVRMVSDDALKNSLAAVRQYQNNVRTALPVKLPETAPAMTASAVSVPASTPVAQSASHAFAPKIASNPELLEISKVKTASEVVQAASQSSTKKEGK